MHILTYVWGDLHMSLKIRAIRKSNLKFFLTVFLSVIIIINFTIIIMNKIGTKHLSDEEKLTILRQMNLDEIEKLSTSKQYSETAEEILSQFIDDAICFPIPISTKTPERFVNYTDSWGYARSYGGERQHEGTDIMADYNVRGYYPVVSITDGIIEKIGWLELGGYRIGIRSPSGGYFYYAHLYNYADGIKEGDSVKAGQLIAYMGDSGYSNVEGTVGNFDVHLHVGIYVMFEGQEVSVNPYYLLKRLQIMKANY